MAVYYKFKSAKDYDTVAIEGHFISVANLKDKIFETKHLGRGTDFDLVISNAQTNEEYLDEATLVPKNTSVLVRRVPGRPRMPITTEKREEKVTEIQNEQITSSKNGFQANDYNKYPDESEWDEFGTDLYAIPEVPVPLGIPVISQPDMTSKADEDSKIKAFVDSSASDWQRQTQEFSGGRGYGRGGGRGFGGRGFGRVLERKTPPQGYVCHRCKIPGHFIQHCPTNGDPNYDIKKVKPPTGIPKSMLVATPDGSYALPSGAVACLKPNEAAFEKEVEGLPSNRSVAELPPELRCPLCKDVMKDAVLTSKCCFKSYCDKCIRDYIISKSMCVCGKTRVLADDLLPNKTLRETIDRILEHNNTSSQDNAGSFMHVQDMESAKFARPKAPSPSFSGCVRDSNRAPSKSDFLEIKENGATEKASGNHTQQSTEKNPALKSPEPFVNAIDSASTKEPVSQESAPVIEEEVQQKIPAGDLAKKKKKKRTRQPSTNNDMQWRVNQDFGAEGCMMPYSAAAYNPYWSVPQWGPEGYMNPAAMPFMPYGPGGCVMPPEMYGAQGYMPGFMPPVNRDYMDYSMSAQNSGNKVMSREEFEARKADLKRKRENDQRHSGRDYSKNEYDGEADMGHSRARMRMQSQVLPHGTHRREERGMSTDRQREPERLSSSPKSQGKRRSDKEGSYGRDGRNHTDVKLDSQLMLESEVNKTSKLGVSDKPEKKPKGSVFSRISFPGKRDDDFHAGPAKKKTMNSLEPPNGFREQEVSRHTNNIKPHYDDTKSTKRIPNGRRINHEEDFSDNEQNFKRKAPAHRHDRSNDRDGEKHSDVGSRSSKHVRERIH